jgi:hypothetical protein
MHILSCGNCWLNVQLLARSSSSLSTYRLAVRAAALRGTPAHQQSCTHDQPSLQYAKASQSNPRCHAYVNPKHAAARAWPANRCTASAAPRLVIDGAASAWDAVHANRVNSEAYRYMHAQHEPYNAAMPVTSTLHVPVQCIPHVVTYTPTGHFTLKPTPSDRVTLTSRADHYDTLTSKICTQADDQHTPADNNLTG